LNSKTDLLDEQNLESRDTRLVMAQSSSMMLVEMNAGEIEAQLHVNPVDFENSMDASSFEYEQIWHDSFQFHVQISSKIHPEHESINRECSCVKNLKNICERKIWKSF
jgi:hypothetical protein